MTRLTLRLLVALALGTLGGCNGPGTTDAVPAFSPQSTRNAVRDTRLLLYVSDPVAGDVVIYRLHHETDGPIGTIKRALHHPAGLGIGPDGTLYAANTANDTVTAYAATNHALVKTYSSGISGPVGVAVDSGGNVFVANFHSFIAPVVRFAPGQMSPTMLLNPGSMYPIGLTAHSDGSIDVAYDDFYGRSWVCRYAQNVTKCHVRTLQVPITKWESAGLAFDSAGNLLVANATLPGVEIFEPERARAKRVIARRGSPRLLAVADGELVVTDTAHNAISIYDYPSGRLEHTVTTGLRSAYGVAIGP